MAQDIVYRTSDGAVLRYADSPCDFANDGSHDSETETIVSNHTAQRLTPDRAWSWNGSSFTDDGPSASW